MQCENENSIIPHTGALKASQCFWLDVVLWVISVQCWNISIVLHQSHFLFHFWSFLAAQYGFVGRWLNPGRATIGALDLGGASTQITFETSEKVEDEDNAMELKLYGQTYRLYTQSFLCYGQDQFLRKLLARLITVLLRKSVKTVTYGCCRETSRFSWFLSEGFSFFLTAWEVRGQDQLNNSTLASQDVWTRVPCVKCALHITYLLH